MDHILEIREFFVEGKDHKRSHVLLHIAEPVTKKEKERGFFFVVAEINNGYEEQIESLQQIIDDVEAEYYNEQLEEVRTLEEILQDVNRRAHHVLKYEDTHVHCVLGVVLDTSISLAYHGKPHAILFYASKGNLAVNEIITEESSGLQLFSELIEGNMNPGDYMVITTPMLTQFFSEDRMGKLLSTRRIEESASHMQKVLHDLRHDFSFGGLIVHVTGKHDRPKTGKLPHSQERGSEESLNQLMASTKSTEETLSPPLLTPVLSNLKHRLAKRKQRDEEDKPAHARTHKQYSVETNYRRGREDTNESFFGKFLIGLGHALVFVGTALILLIRKVSEFIGYILKTSYALITNKGNGRAKTIQMWRNAMRNQKNFFKNLPLTSKIILIATIILAGSFLGSLGYLKKKERQEQREVTYGNMIQAIIDKKDAAEAALVYNEKGRAFTLLQEAQTILKQLPGETNSKAEKVKELQTSLEIFLQDLRNITKVAPELIVQFDTGTEGKQLTDVLKAEQHMLVFGPEVNDVMIVDLLTKGQTKQPLDTIKYLTSGIFNRDDKTGYFITQGSKLASYNIESRAIAPKDISYPKDDARIGAITLYNGKFYTLDTKNSQLYKHNRTQTGFDKGAPWITGNSLDLSEATAVTIDGNIFIGTNKGELLKLFKGERQAFEITGLDPAFASIDALWTSGDTDTLYILDGAQKRVVLLDKDGRFKKQFTADEWQKPAAMHVEEADGVVYVLDSNKLYKFLIK